MFAAGPPQRGLPARPDQGRGYDMSPPRQGRQSGGQGPLLESPPFERRRAPTQSQSGQSPPGKVILEGYRQDLMSGFQGERPRYNPMNIARPQSSTLLNINDPIQVHLLVETALGDSKDFELLSQEEVDDLKKVTQTLMQRIEQTKQNLAIQAKYRDAAISMAKLYSPSEKKKSMDSTDGKRRRSILGHKSSGSDQIREAEIERISSERRCEELAAELWSLEKRLIEPQSRLLRHTAGILQMTHRGPKMSAKSVPGLQQAGVPGSPESLYTYSNQRSSMEHVSEENFFDERSLYRAADRFDVQGNFAADGDMFSNPREQALQMKTIVATEQKLADLNAHLREVIVKANPELQATYLPPPPCAKDGQMKDAESIIQNQLQYLEQGLVTIDQEGGRLSSLAMEEQMEDMNREMHMILALYEPNRSMPPHANGQSMNEQFHYFQDSLGAIEVELARANKSSQDQGGLEQMETVLRGLWEIIQSGEAEARQQKLERRQAQNAMATRNGLASPVEEESEDDGGDPDEPFTLQAFSGKVQWLYMQATRLKDQKKVLQRQIKQQRELNNRSDAAKDAEMIQKDEELERTHALLTRTEQDADAVREQLSAMMEELDRSRERETLGTQSRDNAESAAVLSARQELKASTDQIALLEDELQEHNAKIGALEDELQEIRDDHAIAELDAKGTIEESGSKIEALTGQLATLEAAMSKKDVEIEAKEKEVEEVNMELALLRTEVTIARAELDGAYGSRAQRAAESANGTPAMQKQMDELKHELEETIEEYESMTKASLEWERERERLEQTIDKLRDERESLEGLLSDEKVRWLGMRSPGVGAEGGMPPPDTTSTTVLKNEFKKMMRDTRAESTKALRVEQAERRRVEEELRALKRQHGPGKSSLSQSLASS